MIDLIIQNGTIVDGSGESPYQANIYINNNKIVVIKKDAISNEDLSKEAQQVISAEGLIVAPGFVDIHTHYDAQVFWDPSITPSSNHGVTTIIAGNCGFSIAPLSGNDEDAEYLKRMLSRVEGMSLESLDAGVPWGSWKSFGDYLSCLDNKLAINAGFLVGHSAVRRTVMGERSLTEQANSEDLEQMKTLLRESISEGGLGFSTTVSVTHNDMEGRPVPSRVANDEELFALASICSEFPGTMLEFLPGVKEFDDDIKERMTQMSLAAQRPLNWNLFVPGDPKIDESLLSATDYARERGAEVLALTPAQPILTRINLHSAFIFDAFPGWDEIMRLPIEERKEALKDSELRKKLDEGAHSEEAGLFVFMADWKGYTIEEAFLEKNKKYNGCTIGEIAAELGKEPFDTLLDFAIEEDLKTSFLPLIYGDDENSWRARARTWNDDRTIVGASDAGAHLDMIDTFSFCTQMLSNGVHKYKLIPIEKAIEQLTSLPAKLVGLKERGLLKEGYYADIVIFDINTIGCDETYTKHDLPTGAGRLYAEAKGIKHVFVNGTEILRDNQSTQQFPGQVLRSGQDTYTVNIPASQ